jgi:hypothetical protein
MNKFDGYPRVLRRLLPLMLGALMAALVAACGGDDDGHTAFGGIAGAPAGAIIPGAVCTAAVGVTIPTVTNSDPSHGNQVVTTSSTGVAAGGKLITATFSLAMNAATINTTSFTLTPVGGAPLVPASVAYDASTKVATLTTAAALQTNTSYTAIISMAAQTTPGGVPLACIQAWNFKTAAVASTGLAPVNLGLATPVAVVAAAGVTNTLTAPLTHINGDVVLDLTTTCNGVTIGSAGTFGACNGAAPTLTGSVISPLFPDGGVSSGAMKSALNAAYLSIVPANLPGATVLGCGTIGSAGGAGSLVGCAGNATLPPGVYISATASTVGVTGVLTLDGGGDANARFVFQVPSALTTAAGSPGVPGSQILLTHGAKASNVWWQVGSSATIGTYADFKGNVLADTSILLGTSATSCGRLLAGAVTSSGLIAFDTNVVSVPGNSNAPAGCQ